MLKIKRYVAATMEQALQEVKAEFGPTAIILEARRRPRFLGIFGRGGVEVIAAVDPSLRVASDRRQASTWAAPAEPRRQRPAAPPMGGGAPAGGAPAGGALTRPPAAPEPLIPPDPPSPAPAPRPAAIRAYRVESASVAAAAPAEPLGPVPDPPAAAPAAGADAAPAAQAGSLPGDRATLPRWPAGESGQPAAPAQAGRAARGTAPRAAAPKAPRVVAGAAGAAPARRAPAPADRDLAVLLRCEVSPETAAWLLEGGARIGDPRFAERLEQLAAARLGFTGQGERVRSIAFVGPTGTGKTTTLAKLASRAVLVENRSVALITLDTYRVGAVDQLRTYAEILDVPLYVAYTAEDLRQAVEQASDADLVLVDTAGRAPSDAVSIGRLRQALEQVAVDEIHLVVAAGTRLLDAQYLGRTYGRLGANRLLLTKLDETLALGSVLELPAVLGLPVSYFTFGQSVPDDIEVATPARAAARILDALRLAAEGVSG